MALRIRQKADGVHPCFREFQMGVRWGFHTRPTIFTKGLVQLTERFAALFLITKDKSAPFQITKDKKETISIAVQNNLLTFGARNEDKPLEAKSARPKHGAHRV